jgi:hypothetical protein
MRICEILTVDKIIPSMQGNTKEEILNELCEAFKTFKADGSECDFDTLKKKLDNQNIHETLFSMLLH